MKSWSGRAGYNLGTPSMASYYLIAGLKACDAQKPKCSPLPFVGMTKSALEGLFSGWFRDSRPWKHGLARAVMLIFSLLGSAHATSAWEDPARELARKVAESTGPGAVAVEVGNRSSMSKADVSAVRTALEGELAKSGVRLVDRERAQAVVVVTLSENVREYVWLAEIAVGKNERSVVVVAVPRGEAGTLQAAGSGVVLKKQLLWTQEEAVLDVVMLDSGAHMAVLDGSRVTLLHWEKGKWQMDQELPVQHGRAWPRDLRGRLVVGKDHLLDVYLPGAFCQTTQHGALALECVAKDEAWPLDDGLHAAFDAKRNYFTGTISPAVGKFTSVPAFYSAVALPREKYTLWVFTGMDGTVHAVDGMTDQVWHAAPWGSDAAAVHTGCGTGWQVAASGKTDAGNDELKVYDVPDREPMAMSAGLNFPGRITALWAGLESQAVAVIHNEEASRYEVYRVLFTCGD
jgi:hypothetical protein